MKIPITSLLFIILLLSIPLSKDNKSDILIVSDQDGLEWNVADYLERHFSDEGYSVNNILISECTKNDYACHGVVILMNALENNKVPVSLQNKIQKYKNNLNDNNQETIFFISTISGEEWDNEKKVIDGITSASEMEDAEPIAKRIIEKIQFKLGHR